MSSSDSASIAFYDKPNDPAVHRAKDQNYPKQKGQVYGLSFGTVLLSTALLQDPDLQPHLDENPVGGADVALAQARIRALLQTGTLTGLVCGALYLGTSLLLPIFYPRVEPEVTRIAFWGIVINAAIHLIKVRNMIQVGVILGGGDARGAVIGDVAGAFVLGLPLAYLLGFTAGFGVRGIFLARAIEEIIKTTFFGWRVSRLHYGRFTAGRNIFYNNPPPVS